MAADQFNDQSHDLMAVAEALVTVVDEQFPQKPRAFNAWRLRVDLPRQHDKPDGLIIGVNGPDPWVRLWDLRGFCQRGNHGGHEALLIRSGA